MLTETEFETNFISCGAYEKFTWSETLNLKIALINILFLFLWKNILLMCS
jgi:hypothetical protein